MERALWSYSNSNSLECKRHARVNPSWRTSQLISTGIITKTISRMRSDKADLSNCHPDAMDYMHLGNWHSRGVWPNLQHNLECYYRVKLTVWTSAKGVSEQRLEDNYAINKGVRVHIGETCQAESSDWRDAVQIYVRPWWHSSCGLHFSYRSCPWLLTSHSTSHSSTERRTAGS